MLALANDIFSRASRLILSGADAPALWTISVQGRVIGSLVREAGTLRLSWFDGADHRLRSFGGALDGDVETLARALSERISQPVQLESLPV
jgi:hypothetical protein